MSYIVVSTFDHQESAGRVHRYLQESNLIDIDDAAVVIKDEKGNIHIKNETYLGRNIGAAGGGLLSLLIGGVILPVGGLLIGALGGGLIGKKIAPAIDKQFIKDISEDLSPGTSAIFIIVRKDTPDSEIEVMQNYKGKVYYTSMPTEAESELRNALSGVGHKLVDNPEPPEKD